MVKQGVQYPISKKHKDSLLSEGLTVGKVINFGKYGHVCEGTMSTKTGSKTCKVDIAVKIVELDKQSENYVKHFLPKEMKAMETLKHEFIITIHKILLKDNTVYVFMEKALGGDLINMLDDLKKAVPEPSAKGLYRGIAKAVKYIHEKGFAHRDIKSENVLLFDKKRTIAKLTDFGFSTACFVPKTGKRQLSDTLCGTPYYSPPEMHRQKPYDAMKSDIFSLGVVLFIMVNNEMPFTDIDILKVSKDPNQPLNLYFTNKSLSKEVIDLITKQLITDPNKRLNIDQVLSHKWLQ